MSICKYGVSASSRHGVVGEEESLRSESQKSYDESLVRLDKKEEGVCVPPPSLFELRRTSGSWFDYASLRPSGQDFVLFWKFACAHSAFWFLSSVFCLPSPVLPPLPWSLEFKV
jgi:hypothetical protein